MSNKNYKSEIKRNYKPLQIDYDGNGINTKLESIINYANVMGEVRRDQQKHGEYYKKLASQDLTPGYHYGKLEELYTMLRHRLKK